MIKKQFANFKRNISTQLFNTFFITIKSTFCLPAGIASPIATVWKFNTISNPLAPKRTHPSADRNCPPIADALSGQVDHSTANLQLLEISSGTGQHVGYLAPRHTNITFQPTEFDAINFDSIRAYVSDCPTKNILDPLFVDILNWEACPELRRNYYDYMLNINMIHISKWECTLGLFRAASQLLKPKGTLFTYGPYAHKGVLVPASNVQFNLSLQTRDPEWGVRDIVDLEQVAAKNGLKLKQSLNMPSNNKFLTWIKLK